MNVPQIRVSIHALVFASIPIASSQAQAQQTMDSAAAVQSSTATATTAVAATAKFGDPLPGLSSADVAKFNFGKTEFNTSEDAEDGLGPVFNGDACGVCHTQGALGGAGTQVETRFGKLTNGVFDPLANLGGSLIQNNGIGQVGSCNYVAETVPSQANTRAGRLTTPLFGLGLIDAIPSAALEALALSQPSEVRGRTNRVLQITTGQTVVGKFGWKAQVPTVFQFAGDAYLNEMGITSAQFPKENCPQGNCALLSCDPVPEVNGTFEDDGTDVQGFADFMTMLAPPPTLSLSVNAQAGRTLFNNLGCASCHTPQQVTGGTGRAATSFKIFSPYSDFLLHDMGALGDQIGGQGRATIKEMRTAPLWGLRARTLYLHDGRTNSLDTAITAHDGQGKKAGQAYKNLLPALKAQVLAFLTSI